MNRRRIWTILSLIVLVAAGGFVVRMVIHRWSSQTEMAAPAGKGKILFYRHPMRADVTSPVPTKDAMGMDFIPVYDEEVSGSGEVVGGHAPLTLSIERQQLIGVTTAKAERKNINFEIRTVGKVAYDPELYNTMAEYREAVMAKEKIKDSPSPGALGRAEALVRSVMIKLRLLGLSEELIQTMTRENPIDPLTLLLPGKSVWVYAQIYEYEMDLVQAGQSVIITVPSAPGKTYAGKVAAVDSVLNPNTRSVRARIAIATPESRLRPETFVHVKIHVPLGHKLSIPQDAALSTGEHHIVFIKKGAGEFEPRSVKLGREAQGYYEVLSGLKEGEEVVTSANFLIDSESRLRAALSAFSKTNAPAAPSSDPP